MFLKRVYDAARPGLRAPGLRGERPSPCSPLLPWTPGMLSVGTSPRPHFCEPPLPQVGMDGSLSPSPNGGWHLSFLVPGPCGVSRVVFAPAEASVVEVPVSFPRGHLLVQRVPCAGQILPLRGRPASRVNVVCKCVSRLSTHGPALLTSSPAFLPLLPEQSPSKWYWKLVPVSELRVCARLPSSVPSRRNHLLPLQIARDCLSECPPWWCCCISCGAVMARFWAQ